MSIQAKQTVNKYIQVSLGFKPNYSVPERKIFNFCNHLYMAAIAMGRMNADDYEIEKFSYQYLKDHNLKQIKREFNKEYITQKNFSEHIGDYDKFEEYFFFFIRENQQKNLKQIISEYLPILSPGIGSELFHCLIYLGYAIDWEMKPKEIFYSLAYLCLQNCVIYPDERSPEKKDVFKTLQELKDLMPYFKQIIHQDDSINISKKMKNLLKDDKIYQVIPQEIDTYDNILDDLQLFILKLYIETQSFLILHIVSGITCLRQLLPFIKEQDKNKIINDFIRHVLLGYCASDIEHLSEIDLQKKLQIPENLPSWEEIFKKTNNSSDDHDIKFVYICSVEANYYGQESEHGIYARYAAHLRMLEKNSKY